MPDAVIATMEKTQTVPLAIEWSAPRDGIVLERNVVDGMRAQPGDVLFRVADTSVVWAMADVAERDLGLVAVGQKVAVKARSFPGREFAGTIAVIYPQINRDTRTARVRVELGNADLVLLPDMYVDAEINAGVLGLGRTFGLFGRMASVAVAQPYLSAQFTGTLDGEPAEASRSGFGDTKLRASLNLFGNPAMTPAEFAQRRPETTVGASLTISAPTDSQSINAGSFSLKTLKLSLSTLIVSPSAEMS